LNYAIFHKGKIRRDCCHWPTAHHRWPRQLVIIKAGCVRGSVNGQCSFLW